MPVPKSDHAAKTAALALNAAKAAAKAAADAAAIAQEQRVVIARLEERQVAAGDKFDTFYGAWCNNATTLRTELKEIKELAVNHQHPDVATKLTDHEDAATKLTKRVDDLSGSLRNGNIFAGVGIGLVGILSAVAAYFDFHK